MAEDRNLQSPEAPKKKKKRPAEGEQAAVRRTKKSAAQENGASVMRPGDILTVRGSGRFRLLEESHTTKKGRMFVRIEVFL